MDDKLLSFEHRLEQLEAKVEKLEKLLIEAFNETRKANNQAEQAVALVHLREIQDATLKLKELERTPYLAKALENEDTVRVFQKLRDILRQAEAIGSAAFEKASP